MKKSNFATSKERVLPVLDVIIIDVEKFPIFKINLHGIFTKFTFKLDNKLKPEISIWLHKL